MMDKLLGKPRGKVGFYRQHSADSHLTSHPSRSIYRTPSSSTSGISQRSRSTSSTHHFLSENRRRQQQLYEAWQVSLSDGAITQQDQGQTKTKSCENLTAKLAQADTDEEDENEDKYIAIEQDVKCDKSKKFDRLKSMIPKRNKLLTKQNSTDSRNPDSDYMADKMDGDVYNGSYRPRSSSLGSTGQSILKRNTNLLRRLAAIRFKSKSKHASFCESVDVLYYEDTDDPLSSSSTESSTYKLNDITQQ